MQLVERHVFTNNKKLTNICFLSKNLYNQANYIMNINNMYNGWIVIPQNQVYSGHYLPLLRQSAEIIGTNISTVEMILFNYAPILAEQIIENYG